MGAIWQTVTITQTDAKYNGHQSYLTQRIVVKRAISQLIFGFESNVQLHNSNS